MLHQFNTVDQLEKAIPVMVAFLDSQNQFFNQLQNHVHQARLIGSPILPQLETYQPVKDSFVNRLNQETQRTLGK